MRRRVQGFLMRGATASATMALLLVASAAPAHQARSDWTERFGVEAKELVSSGRNPFFVLEAGYRLVLTHEDEQLAVTVLAETKVVDGVETRVVEERETKGGALVEVSRNYFAISNRTNAVFYFGEDVDTYKAGKVVNHEGSWTSGTSGARYGLMMPGTPLLHGRYYQELAPKIAMDRAEIVSMSERVTTPSGAYIEALKIEETSPLEPGLREYKLYARGVGLVQDGDFKLVRTERVSPR